MIRYSSYGSANYRTPSSLPDPDPLKAAYRELLELRERVRNAEAAAARRLTSCERKPATDRWSLERQGPQFRGTPVRSYAPQIMTHGDDPWVGTKLPKRTNLTLPDEPLPLSVGVLKSLSEAARAMGKDSTARLVSDLLEKIASDGLYKAVLDEEPA